MKRIIILMVLSACLARAFAVEKGDFTINATINLGHHSFIPNGKVSGLGFVPGITLNMDYAVSDYFGFGGWFTFSGKRYAAATFKYRNFGLGVRGTFHLYQLISDKGNTALDGDKFDLYIPFHIGGGFKTRDKNLPGDKFKAGLIVGSAIGITYYFVDHVGANMEGGYCEGSYGKFGLSFKF